LDDEVERLHMRARRDLRHHPAERRVLVDLREHHVRANPPRSLRQPLHHRRRGLVAGRLDPEHQHLGFHFSWHREFGALSPCGQCAPPPLVGEGGGGGCRVVTRCIHLATPTPDPSPQGGGERTDFAAVDSTHAPRYAALRWPPFHPAYHCEVMRCNP